MKFSEHPLWLVGFRPFFSLACLSGLFLPVLWTLIFSGMVRPPIGTFSIIQWHAHEMLFGFGWAVLGGFLLTSTKNWVKQRGYHGNALIYLVIAWSIERAGMWFEGSLPPLLFSFSSNLFLGSLVAMLTWTLIRHRKSDDYPDNYYFLIVLPLFLVAKNLLLAPEYFQVGWLMAVGLFRMAFLVMFERTLTQFMRNVFQVSILRNSLLDGCIKLLALILVFSGFLPEGVVAGLSLLLALLLLIRFMFWSPMLAMRRLDIGVMYLGYLSIVVALLVDTLAYVSPVAWVGTVSVHLFTFGAMGLVIPAMLIRIAKGHTGRKVVFDRYDKLVLYLMMFGLVVRIAIPQFYPAGYLYWIHLAAVSWFVCFGMLGWRYVPYLLSARVDGKVH